MIAPLPLYNTVVGVKANVRVLAIQSMFMYLVYRKISPIGFLDTTLCVLSRLCKNDRTIKRLRHIFICSRF